MINLKSIKLYILSILKSPRLWSLSLKFFVLCILSLAAIPVGCSIVIPKNANLGHLGPAVTILAVGLTVSGICGLISLITGVVSARQKKIVLIWVIPLYIAVVWIALLGLLSTFSSDDVIAIIGIWFVSSAIIGFILWILNILYNREFKYTPWWSVPIWGIVSLILIIMFGR